MVANPLNFGTESNATKRESFEFERESHANPLESRHESCESKRESRTNPRES